MRTLPSLLLILNCWSLDVYSQSNALVRFDGLYQSETVENEDYRYFLRFYEDGIVISVTSSSEAVDLLTWLRKENNHEGIGKGKFEINDKNMYFTTSSIFGSIVYRGKLMNEFTISFNIKSLVNGHEHERTFYFIKDY